MLTAEENAQLTTVGPGTLIGDLMRQYWIPVVLSSELAPGGRVKRVRLLGEDLVAYRGPSGRVGVLAEFCAHRRASLYFARNEERGLRCVYHGWQYDPCGRCVDMPNERPESNFQDKVTLPAYPCAERGGVVWTYMGPASPPPGLPDLEWAWCRRPSGSSPSSGRTATTSRRSRAAWTPRTVESRTRAVAYRTGGACCERRLSWPLSPRSPSLRLASPLIEPDVTISVIRLSDGFHGRHARGRAAEVGSDAKTPSSPNTAASGNCRYPGPATLCLRRRKRRTE